LSNVVQAKALKCQQSIFARMQELAAKMHKLAPKYLQNGTTDLVSTIQ